MELMICYKEGRRYKFELLKSYAGYGSQVLLSCTLAGNLSFVLLFHLQDQINQPESTRTSDNTWRYQYAALYLGMLPVKTENHAQFTWKNLSEHQQKHQVTSISCMVKDICRNSYVCLSVGWSRTLMKIIM